MRMLVADARASEGLLPQQTTKRVGLLTGDGLPWLPFCVVACGSKG